MKKITLTLLLIFLGLIVSSCNISTTDSVETPEIKNENKPNNPSNNNPNQPKPPFDVEIGPSGEEPKSEVNDDIVVDPGTVEVNTDYQITYISGTNDIYSVDGNTITFNTISADTVYSIKGSLDGNIVINVGDGYKFELQFNEFTITTNNINPITILSGDEVQLTEKKIRLILFMIIVKK